MRKILYFIKCDIIYLLAHLIPKDKNLWIFGSWFGRKYWGNAKYLFEYIVRYHPEIKAVWLTKSKEVYDCLSDQGYPVCDACSVRGIWYAMRAHCCLITHNMYDLNEYAVAGSKIVQLRRGTPFLKVVGDEFVHRKKTLKLPLYSNTIEDWKEVLVITTAKEVSGIYTRWFGVPENYIMVTGYPRNDVFFQPDKCRAPVMELINSYREQNIKIGFFMPHGSYTWFLSYEKQINDALKKRNVILLSKPYACRVQSDTESLPSLSNIVYLSDEQIWGDPYPVLPHADFLITDYSTIFLDYLLLDKPIIFSPVEDTSHEFFYPYDKVTPGPKITSWEDMIIAIDNALQNPRQFDLERAEIRKRFNTFVDGDSSKRVYDAVMQYLEKGV